MKPVLLNVLICLLPSLLLGQANFIARGKQGCAPITVNFNDKSIGAVNWLWDFGNGNTSTLQNPSAQFINEGKFTVSLTVWDAAGNKTQKTEKEFVWVFKNPKAKISMQGPTVCQNETTVYSENSLPGDANITSWRWDWGNGKQSNVASPSYAYPSAGVYNVSLLITDANGCQDNLNLSKWVTVNPEPLTDFIADKQYDCEKPSTVQFTDKTPGGADIVAWDWDFGDGGTSNLQNPSYTFTAFGSYNVSLTTTNKNGCKKKLLKPAYITLGELVVDFTADKRQLCKGGAVKFEYVGPRNGQLLVKWNFDDGSADEIGFFPKHTFTNAKKSYTVKLTVQSITKPKCKVEIVKPAFITVNNLPAGKIVSDYVPPCSDNYLVNVKYIDTAEGNTLNWTHWKLGEDLKTPFGTGGLSEKLEIQGKQENKIQVTVTNKYGCKSVISLDSIMKTTNINAFFNGDSNACMPLYMKLSSKSQELSDFELVEQKWYLDNNLIHNGESYTHFFDSNRKYFFKLVVKDKYGCTDSFSKPVLVGRHMDPFFKLDTIPILCSNEPYRFVNLTKYPGWTVDSFMWFNDKSNPKHDGLFTASKLKKFISLSHWARYDMDSGYVSPMLVSVNNSCHDTIILEDSVFIKGPHAQIKVEYSPCEDSLVTFINTSTKQYHRLEWKVGMNTILLKDKIQFPASQINSVMLKLYNDSTGCEDTEVSSIVPKVFICDPIVNTDGSCVPVKLTLNNTSNNENTKWFINELLKVNGATPKNPDGSVEFNLDSAGMYKLVMSYQVGNCVILDTQIIQLFDNNLKGSVTLSNQCSPASVQLVDSTFNSNVQHFWEMDGSFYNVSSKIMNLPLTNANGADSNIIILKNNASKCPASKSFVVASKAPSFEIKSGFVADCSLIEWQANAIPNTKRSNPPFTFDWTISNGTKFSSQIIKFKTTDTGWQFAVVKVTDADGCYMIDTIPFYVPAHKLKVNFKSTQTGSVCTPMQVQFNDLSTTLSGKIVSWLWDFGDNSFSTIKHPSHQYLKQGVYNVSLTVTDENGCKKTLLIPGYLKLVGLTGSYKFDKNKGCAPISIQFLDSSNSAESKYEWDFGNGDVRTGKFPKYTYTQPGAYIPSLIIREKPGCVYKVPQTDTIFVYGVPESKLSGNGVCLNEIITFKSGSSSLHEPIVSHTWNLPGGKKITGNNTTINHRFEDKLQTWVQLITSTSKGCSDTALKIIKLRGPELFLSGKIKDICLGGSIQVNGFAISDTTINNTKWLVNGQSVFSGNLLNFIPQKAGLYKLTFKATDDFGCWDTLSFVQLANVGDTFTPPLIPIHYASVQNDNTHELTFYKLNTADFKNYKIWRNEGMVYQVIKTINSKDDTMHLFYGVDALLKSYCYQVSLTNLCDINNEHLPKIAHCTVESKAQGALNSAIVNWSPYVGWTVDNYVIWRLNNTSGNWDSIGRVSGLQYSFIDTTIACKQHHYYRIKATKLGDRNTISFSDTCRALPIYQNTVNPPYFTRATVEQNKYVKTQWEELMPNRNPIIQYEVQKQNGSAYTNLAWKPANASWSIDDNEVDVQSSPYQYRLRSVDNCLDTSAFVSIARSIHLRTTISNLDRPIAYWTHYKAWSEGVREYVIEKRNGNTAFQEIGRVAGTDSFYIDNISQLNCIPWFEYRVYAIRNVRDSIVSYSNQSSPSAVPKIFVPNAFSPNNNKLNDVFRPDGVFISSYTLYIYNRWGQKLYENSDCMNAWDGTYQNELAPDGVYAWYVEALGVDNKTYKFKGTVTLIR